MQLLIRFRVSLLAGVLTLIASIFSTVEERNKENAVTTGNKNTLLGATTAASAAAGTNQTVIGYGASGIANNSVTIGNSDVTA